MSSRYGWRRTTRPCRRARYSTHGYSELLHQVKGLQSIAWTRLLTCSELEALRKDNVDCGESETPSYEAFARMRRSRLDYRMLLSVVDVLYHAR